MTNNPNDELDDFINGQSDELDVSKLYYNNENTTSDSNAETTLPVHDNKGGDMRKLSTRNASEMTTLPVFGTEIKTVVEKDENGIDIIKDIPIMRSSHTSLRMCNTCFVAASCPAFKASNTCAFSLPVEVKTKEQLSALLNAIIEMQGQRIAFARFAEELNGGYPDPNTSQEVDRLFKLLKTMKDLEDNSSYDRMTVEAKNGGGVLSQIFGEKAQNLSELPNGGYDEEQVTRIIQQNIEE